MTASDRKPDVETPVDGADAPADGGAPDLERTATVLGNLLPLLRRLRAAAARDKPP